MRLNVSCQRALLPLPEDSKPVTSSWRLWSYQLSCNTAVFWQQGATLRNDISRKWAKMCLTCTHWHQCNIIMSWLKYNMGYLQHDYILTWTAYDPLILCLSCNKWSYVVLYQNCWKERNAVIWQRCYRESTYTVKVQTQKGKCGTVLTAISDQVANTRIMIIF